LRHVLPRYVTFWRVATRAHRPSRRAGRTSREGATPQTRVAGTPAPACACEYSRVPSHPEPQTGTQVRGGRSLPTLRGYSEGVGFLLPIWQVHYLGPVLDARLAEDTKDLLKLVSLQNDTMPPHRPSLQSPARCSRVYKLSGRGGGLSGRGLRGRGLSRRGLRGRGGGLSGTWKAVLPCRGLASVPQNNGFELISSARMHPGQPRDISPERSHDIQPRTVT
jgi:hypothetical protein